MTKNYFLQALKNESWLTISNVLTILRILFVPIIMVGVFHQAWLFAFIFFLIAAVTDFFDGHLARLLEQQTIIGKILDPIADKFLLIGCFGALSFLDSPSFSIPKWFFLMVVGRELIILLGTSLLMTHESAFKVQPNFWGKSTTFCQLLFISWIFVCYFFGWAPVRTYSFFLVLLALFSVFSFLQYVKIYLQYQRR